MAKPKDETPADMTPETQSASAAREEAMLDLMGEMQARINILEAKQGHPVATSKTDELQEKFDSELDALAEEFKDFPSISMVTRRALDGTKSVAIRLKRDADAQTDEACYWALRWFDFGRENRAVEMAQRGWEKVRWDELQSAEALMAGVKTDDYVRRGDRGLEVLAKMPRKLYNHLKRREAAIYNGLLSSESGLRNHLANTTSSAVGKAGGNADQAGSMVASPHFTVEITAGPTERVGVA